VPHRSEVRGARCRVAGRWPSPPSVLALASLSPASLTFTGWPFSAAGGVPAWRSTPPGLRFLRGLGRDLPHPSVPRGVPAVRVHARSLRIQRVAGRSCHPSSAVSWDEVSEDAVSEDAVLPGEQPLGRCLVQAPEGARSSPTRGPAWRCSRHFGLSACRSRARGLWSRASSTRRLPRARRLPSLRVKSPEGAFGRRSCMRPGSLGASRKRPATSSLAGLLSW
jgi:hypothetical protein